MLLMECAFVLQSASLPTWMLPTTTPHEIISTMHRLFPAFMSGCRCIIGAFHVELKDRRVEALEPVVSGLQTCTNQLFQLLQLQLENLENRLLMSQDLQSSESSAKLVGEGIMERATKQAMLQVDTSTLKSVNDKIKLISRPELLSEQKDQNGLWSILRNFVIYFMIRLMFVKVMNGQSSKSD